jgi:hypothetical protein
MVPFAAEDVADSGRGRPGLVMAPAMPDDLRGLVEATWGRFVDAFPAHADCIERVTVEGAWELEDRATYDPERRVVTVRIPGTAPNLEASLVHEFAHHLELTCPAQKVIRPAFLEAQRFPHNTPWFDGPVWDRIPSEQWAEATAEYVLGRRPAHARTVTSDAAMGVIRAWAN